MELLLSILKTSMSMRSYMECLSFTNNLGEEVMFYESGVVLSTTGIVSTVHKLDKQSYQMALSYGMNHMKANNMFADMITSLEESFKIGLSDKDIWFESEQVVYNIRKDGYKRIAKTTGTIDELRLDMTETFCFFNSYIKDQI